MKAEAGKDRYGHFVMFGDFRSAMRDERTAELTARAFNTHEDLTRSLGEVLPWAEKWVKQLTDQMVGNLYPAINAATIDRARTALENAKPKE